MPDPLRRVLFITHDYLDFYSVVDGYRDVGLIDIRPKKKCDILDSNFSETKFYKISVKCLPVKEQKLILNRFLSTERPDYTLVRAPWKEWRHSYFIVRKTAWARVKEYLRHSPLPTTSMKYQRRLGLQLGYPPCCVKGFARFRPPE